MRESVPGNGFLLDGDAFKCYNCFTTRKCFGGDYMADSKLKNKQTDLLVRALLSLENEEQCYQLLEDLLTIREVRDLSQRLEVAQMLKNKVTYTEIVASTGASTATIGRVNRCLAYGAGGYGYVLNKLETSEE